MPSARCFRIVFGFIGLMFCIEGGRRAGEKRGVPCSEGQIPLANAAGRPYLKKEPRHLLRTDTGVGTARFAPPCTVATAVLFFDPDPSHWAGVNCYSALDAENRTKATAISRMKTVRMADALLFPLAPCQAHGRRATVHACYSVLFVRPQGFSSRRRRFRGAIN